MSFSENTPVFSGSKRVSKECIDLKRRIFSTPKGTLNISVYHKITKNKHISCPEKHAFFWTGRALKWETVDQSEGTWLVNRRVDGLSPDWTKNRHCGVVAGEVSLSKASNPQLLLGSVHWQFLRSTTSTYVHVFRSYLFMCVFFGHYSIMFQKIEVQ